MLIGCAHAGDLIVTAVGPSVGEDFWVLSRMLACSVPVSPEAARSPGFRIAPWLIAGSGSVASFATLT